ncbi:PQQ-binding-like beta-propeller repeat protein [Streptomyces sp. NPDC096324]|uniref:outer membrane protein assembly factor BamB family protein n=1 Tax=Streptomyces sp. NPDC096324 TaxID=3366085 RepID=UPI00380E90A7
MSCAEAGREDHRADGSRGSAGSRRGSAGGTRVGSAEGTGPGGGAARQDVPDGRTGKEYWRYERRDDDADMPSVEVSADTVVAWFDDGRMVGIDLRTGSVRWRTDFAQHGFQDLGAEPRAEFTSDDWAPTSAQDGVIINDAGDEPRDSAHSTVLTAYDTQVGKRAWERRAAAGHSFGSLSIADGRVYL